MITGVEMKMYSTKNVLQTSNVAFGTSGARGLVTDFSEEVCAAFTVAFARVMTPIYSFDAIAIGIDNRPSSEWMAQCIAKAIETLGLKALYYGVLPTPALANQAMNLNIPCVMVTGSHIPFDRNGLKFYRPDGEITKNDELAINEVDASFEVKPGAYKLTTLPDASLAYIERYTSLFDSPILQGKKIGIYEHSSSGRDIYPQIFTALGAEVICLERSNEFVPIDTEAVSEEDKVKARTWSLEYGFDAIFSTDGDGDRPLIADENGDWLRGDVLGLITAKVAGIRALAVPVSCNTAIEQSEFFAQVIRTKIGSPYVIAEFTSLNKEFKSVAGFEANGGFLLGTNISINGNYLTALPTRDAVLPAIMLLLDSTGSSISSCVQQLPQRYTASDRIKNFPTEVSKGLIAQYSANPQVLLEKLGIKNSVEAVNTIDGLRLSLDDNDIIHLRPSGNAPELRCYVETDEETRALQLVGQVLKKIQEMVR